ncbi:MAG: hypothetical protein RSB09_04700 [Clostridia bacterium]
MIGASVASELYATLVAFAFGALGGAPALLFTKKSRPIERALMDFTAIILLAFLFIVAMELGNNGVFQFFQLVAYLIAVPILPTLLKKIKQKNKKKNK